VTKSLSQRRFPVRRSWRLLLAAGACAFAVGCGTRTAPLEGKVTFQGMPIAEGTITLEPAGKGAVVASPISQGTYRATAAPGKYRAMFSAYRTANTPGPDGNPHKIQYLPAKFTVDCQIAVDVPREGNKKLDFDLK
jgi:hypothetical protein